MGLIIFFLIIIGIALIYGFVKAVNVIFNPLIRRLEKTDNPYIMKHRAKIHNDRMYDEYLKWLDKNGGDMPFEKWKTQEEKEVDMVINKNLKL